jgi:uncharacterized membrane protein
MAALYSVNGKLAAHEGIMRIFEVVFFAGIAGCVVTIIASWHLIVKEELAE